LLKTNPERVQVAFPVGDTDANWRVPGHDALAKGGMKRVGFHVTLRKNLRDILSSGLEPSRTRDHHFPEYYWERRRVVCFFLSIKKARRWIKFMNYVYKNPVILEIDLRGIRHYPERGFKGHDGARFTRSRIPAKSIHMSNSGK